MKRASSHEDKERMSSDSHDSYDKNNAEFGIRQNSVQFVNNKDLIWDSTIANMDDDSIDDGSVGSEHRIRSVAQKTSIMQINQK